MKSIKILLVLFSFSLIQAKEFATPQVDLELRKGLVGKNISLYLVNATSAFGGVIKIGIVFKKIETLEIHRKKMMIDSDIVYYNLGNDPRVPNYLVAIVHDQDEHALNAIGISSANARFEKPRIILDSSVARVITNAINKKLVVRSQKHVKSNLKQIKIHL